MRGVEQLNDILDLIRNPDKYEAKARELQDLVNQYKSLVEAHVKVSQVDTFVAETKRRNDEADTRLQQAKAAADRIVSDANSQANKIIEGAQKHQAEAQDYANKARALEAEVDKKLKDISVREKELTKKEIAQAEVSAKNQALAEELNERKAKLMQALS